MFAHEIVVVTDEVALIPEGAPDEVRSHSKIVGLAGLEGRVGGGKALLHRHVLPCSRRRGTTRHGSCLRERFHCFVVRAGMRGV